MKLPKDYYMIFFLYGDYMDEGDAVSDFGFKGEFNTREQAYKAMQKILKGDLPSEDITGCHSVFMAGIDPDDDPTWAEYYETMTPFAPYEVVDVLSKKEALEEAVDPINVAGDLDISNNKYRHVAKEVAMDREMVNGDDGEAERHRKKLADLVDRPRPLRPVNKKNNSEALGEAVRLVSPLLSRFEDEDWMLQVFNYFIDEYVDEHGSTGDAPKRYAQRRIARFKNKRHREELYNEFVSFDFLTEKELADNRSMIDRLVTGWFASNGY